jgi:predicted DNA-binding transcriptional regulator AlpA
MRAANPSKITVAPKDGDRPGTHVAAPTKHHLDQRADRIAGEDVGADDDLLTTRQVADWLGVSTQWVEIGRSKNYGPPFKRLTARSIRYLRDDVLKWLKTRTHASTAEYASPATAA